MKESIQSHGDQDQL